MATKQSFKTQQSKAAGLLHTHIAQAQFQCRTHRHLYNGICSASPDKQARQRLQGSAPGEERRKPLITGILSASSRSGISSPTYPAFSLSIICSQSHSMIVFNLYIKLSLSHQTPAQGPSVFHVSMCQLKGPIKKWYKANNVGWLLQL